MKRILLFIVVMAILPSAYSAVISATTQIATKNEAIKQPDIKIIFVNGGISIENVSSFTIYNSIGQRVIKVNRNSEDVLVKLTSGMYVIKAGDNTQKVIVK